MPIYFNKAQFVIFYKYTDIKCALCLPPQCRRRLIRHILCIYYSLYIYSGSFSTLNITDGGIYVNTKGYGSDKKPPAAKNCGRYIIICV